MSFSERLEFPLAQGWCRGLSIGFENAETSATLDTSKFLQVKQVHGDRIYEPSYRELQGGGLLNVEADGIFLSGGQIRQSRAGLLIKTADCLPLVYVHRVEERVAIVHAGWRGLLKGIHLKPFQNLGFDPKDTWVWLGPSLNGQSFEVGEDMWKLFEEKSDPRIFEPHSLIPSDKRFFYPWRKVAADFARLQVELLYNVEVNTGENKSFASWRRSSLAGLGKVPQQNYSWIAAVER